MLPRRISFDYESLGAEDRAVVQEETIGLREDARTTQQDAIRMQEGVIRMGERLIRVKERLDHGRFGTWLKAEFPWSDQYARDLMNVAKAFKSKLSLDLDLTSTVLRMLAAPSVPEVARQEALDQAANGQHVGTREAREIIDRHREYREYNPELDRKLAEQYVRETDLPGQAMLFPEEELEEEEWEEYSLPPPPRPISPWTSDDLLRHIRRALDHVDDVARAVGAKEKDGGYGGIKGSLARLTASERLRLRAVLENLIDYLQGWADQIEEKFIEEEAG